MSFLSTDQIAMLAAALAQGAVDEPAPVQQPQSGPRRNAAQYNKEIDPGSLGISLLAAAADEINERPTQRASRGPHSNAAQPTGDSLDEIANHILSTFPEFAELLQQTRLSQPVPQQQHHQQDLDTLQQLMMGITQQAEQEQVLQQQQQQQQLALQLQQQQEQLTMQQKQEEQVRLHLQRQQQLKQQQQQQQMQMQQQKQLQALQQQQAIQQQQQQELELLLMQHQQQAALGQQAAAVAAAAAEAGLPASAALSQPQTGLTFNKHAQQNATSVFNMRGGSALSAAAGGAGNSSFLDGGHNRPPLSTPWGNSRKGKSEASQGVHPGAMHPGAQLPQHLASSAGNDGTGGKQSATQDPAAAAAAVSEAVAAAAAVAAVGAAQMQTQDVQQQREQAQRIQQQHLLFQQQQHVEEAEEEEQKRRQAKQKQQQQQKKKKAARGRRPVDSDPDASMSSAPTTDSNADSVDETGDEEAHAAPKAAAAARAKASAQRQPDMHKDTDHDDEGSDTDGDETDDHDAAAQAASAVPMSRRAMLGLPPVGLSRQQQRMAAAHAALHQPVVKTKPAKNKHVVFVWDLDESLVLLHSLINGKYASSSGGLVDAARVAELGRKMQALVMKLIDDKLFFKQLEDVDIVHVQDVWRLAAQYKEHLSRNDRQQQQQDNQGGTAAVSSSTSQEQQQQQQEKEDSGQQCGDATTTIAEVNREVAAAAAAAAEVGDSGRIATAGADEVDAMDVDEQTTTGDKQPAEHSPAAEQHEAEQQVKQAAKQQSSSGDGSERDSSPALVNGNASAAAAAAAAPVADGDVEDVLPPNPSCTVAGSPSVAAEPELVLRPFKLGPTPDVLKALWEEIEQVYDNGSGVLPLSRVDVTAAEVLWEELDAACGGWLSAARKLLDELINTPDLLVSHVLVANSQLVPLLGKLMLFKLDTSFALSNVYSAASAAKMACFKRIGAKYGPKARYIVLGDGLEEESCAEMMEWPFVRISLTHQQELQQPVQPVQSSSRSKQFGAPTTATAETGMPAAKKRQRVASPDVDADGDDDDDDSGEDHLGKGFQGREAQAAANIVAEAGSGSAAAGDAAMAPPTEAEAAAHGIKDGDAGMCEADAADAEASDAAVAAQGQGEQAGQARQQAVLKGTRVRADALSSAGHMLMELTAQQLIKLALSCN